jgi:hypothetical protein
MRLCFILALNNIFSMVVVMNGTIYNPTHRCQKIAHKKNKNKRTNSLDTGDLLRRIVRILILFKWDF